MKGWIFLIVLGVAISCTYRTSEAKSPIVHPLVVAPSELAAVINGIQEIASKHDGVEYGGVVWNCTRGYTRSTVVTSNDPFGVRYSIPYVLGCELIAIFHSHPANPPADTDILFSNVDRSEAAKLGVRSYIWVQMDGSIRIWEAELAGSQPDSGRVIARYRP